MGFHDAQIILNNNIYTYHAGETIFGKLKFQQNNVETLRGIYVKIKGFAHVHWGTRHSKVVDGKTKSCTVNHDAHEDYFYMKQYLVGDEHGEHHLEAGDYSFDFQCVIPAHCPSSFEHKYGHIRYEIKIVLERASKFDHEKKVSIKVISPLDLNQDPYCKEPLVLSCEEIYSCCCLSSGFSKIFVKIPVSGYYVGQIIPVELHCSNKSSVEIEQIKLAIIKIITFTARDRPGRKYDMEQIIEMRKGPVHAFSTKNWIIEIEIPSIPVYNVEACRFIDIAYEFKVTIVPDGCHLDSTDSKRIVLGTVPLIDFDNNSSNPLQEQIPDVQATEKKSIFQFQAQNNTNENDSYSLQNLPHLSTKAPYPCAGPVNPGAIPTYPDANLRYPCANLPYPTTSTSHIDANSLNSKSHQPHPIVIPYPPTNLPYPSSSSDATMNLPYHAAIPPYPVTDSPYPNPNPGLGFRVQGIAQNSRVPSLPVTNVVVAPSAPVPSTPEPSTADGNKKPVGSGYAQGNDNTSNDNYPYNPEFKN